MTATTKQFCALLLLCALHASTSFAQTSRQFTLLLKDRTHSAITPQGEKDGGIDVAMLTCYLPDVPSGRAIVCCPGGGYSHLAMQHEGHNWAEFFTAKGIAFFVLKYRMPNGDRNIPLGDAYEAFRLVRDSAQVWGINPSDVGIMGFSAGGHLASTIATHAKGEAKPDFQILFYPVISMEPTYTHKGSLTNFLGRSPKKRLIKDYSNDTQVNRTTPRAFIALSDDDNAVLPVNGANYYMQCYRHEVPASLHIYPTGGHGWGYREGFAFHYQMIFELKAWLESF
jgi:acetyl esterase/lipase